MWNFSLWALLPPVYSVCSAAGLWAILDELLNYILHKYSILPFSSLSVAGNFPPVSCIFSEVTNLAAFVGFIIAVLRYVQLRHRIDKPWLNVCCLVAFSVACFGMTLVGNFQLFTKEMIHNLGTFLAFGAGTLFCWMQSYITLKVNLNNEGKKVGIIRVLLSGSITACVILYICLMSQGLHMHATQCQWSLVMFFFIFLGTFAIEFRHSRFDIVCTDNCQRPVCLSEPLTEMSTPNQL
uniref:CWH43-like N-terminal domain-containing protein n=1 Tax=Monopterus albus TaxID=43700 RepID=A0A3Q3K4H6_MONAL